MTHSGACMVTGADHARVALMHGARQAGVKDDEGSVSVTLYHRT
jgi:hypothetical protein